MEDVQIEVDDFVDAFRRQVTAYVAGTEYQSSLETFADVIVLRALWCLGVPIDTLERRIRA